jgi:hypothetical protein
MDLVTVRGSNSDKVSEGVWRGVVEVGSDHVCLGTLELR